MVSSQSPQERGVMTKRKRASGRLWRPTAARASWAGERWYWAGAARRAARAGPRGARVGEIGEAEPAVVERREPAQPEIRRLERLVEEVRRLLLGHGQLVGRRPVLGELGKHLFHRRRPRRRLAGVGRGDRREEPEPRIDHGRLGGRAAAVG